MRENYRIEIQRFYEKKKSSGELSLNLMYPTAAKLRNECLALFRTGLNDADYRTLKSFMERPDSEELHESAIRRFDPDKFKPLNNFLRKGTNTDEKNIELLAWLIDFRPRPYSIYRFTAGKNTELLSRPITKEDPAVGKKVTLEYPSGVILSVDANDISLIAQLIRLGDYYIAG
jgi:hypothetical protein